MTLLDTLVFATILIFGLVAILGLLKKIRDSIDTNTKKLADIKINLVNQGSETTTVPYPVNAASCSHVWEAITDKVLENDDGKKMIFIQKCTICGLVDKTIETLLKAKPKGECKHKWIRHETVLESAFEQCRKQYSTFTKKDVVTREPWFFRKTYVCTLTCEECGEVRTIQASNHDLINAEETAEV